MFAVDCLIELIDSLVCASISSISPAARFARCLWHLRQCLHKDIVMFRDRSSLRLLGHIYIYGVGCILSYFGWEYEGSFSLLSDHGEGGKDILSQKIWDSIWFYHYQVDKKRNKTTIAIHWT